MSYVLENTEPLVVKNQNRQSLQSFRKEIDSFYERMKTFDLMEEYEIFKTLSAMTARVSEMRTQIVRNEDRILGAFRTKEIDPFLDECDRQYKFWSRGLSVKTLDWSISGKEA